MITGSYFGFLLNAGHVWRTSRDLFLRVHNWNSTRGKPHGHRICEHLCTRYRAPRYRYRIGRMREFDQKKRNTSKFQAWYANRFMNRLYINHGPPKPTCLEVFMINNLVFRWPKPLFFSWFWVLMEDIASLVSQARLVGLTIPRFGIHGFSEPP